MSIESVVASIEARRHAYDAIVLAQASMAPALDHVGDYGARVLASPKIGVQQALALLSKR